MVLLTTSASANHCASYKMTLGMYIIIFFAVLIGTGAMFFAWHLVKLFGREQPKEIEDAARERKNSLN
tara:strand:+ start:862 stop:1065 length:204 start_codon:yes stop_codon:yes gene_type:complete